MQIIGHRGASGSLPENTLEAFRGAWNDGAAGVELDIHLSADGVPVVIHDVHTGRVAGKTMIVAERPAAALPVPTLTEVLAEAPAHSVVFIEIKRVRADALAEALGPVLAKPCAAALIFLSFHDDLLAELQQHFPQTPRLKLIDRLADWPAAPLAPKALPDYPMHGVAFKHTMNPRDTLLGQWKKVGGQLAVWTENDPDRIDHWRAKGIDFLFTDWPRRFLDEQASKDAS